MNENQARRQWTPAATVGLAIGCTLAGLLLVCIAVSLFLLFWEWKAYPYVQTSSSPGGEYTVTVKSTHGHGFYGPATAKVIARDGWRREIYMTEIFDDGGGGDVHIFWLDENTARAVLYGSEQTDEVVTITFPGGAPVLEAVRLPDPEPLPEDLREKAAHSLGRVSIHDGEHVFWVGLYEDEAVSGITAVVYDLYRQEITQVFQDPAWTPDSITGWGSTDHNGDGFPDFYYGSGDNRTFYLWDPQMECFVKDSPDGVS